MKTLKPKRNRVIAAILAAVIVLSAVITGTLALNTKSAKEVRLTQPNDYITIAPGGSDSQPSPNMNTASVNKDGAAAVTRSGSGFLARAVTTIAAGADAGPIVITTATGTGGINAPINYQIVNPDGIAGYDLPNGGNGYTTKKSGSIADELAKIQYYRMGDSNGSAEDTASANNYLKLNSSNNAAAAAAVTWTSLNTEVVDDNMNIVANGTTILFGKFADRWGVDQTIYYLFGVGVVPGAKNSDLNDLLDAIEKGEKIIDEYNNGNPGGYDGWLIDNLQDAINQGLDDIANGNEDDYKPDADEINNIINDIITSGNDIELGDGVVKVGEEYYKPVLDNDGNPTGVWEKTNASGDESTGIYVGGGTTPDPSIPLYKIKTEDNAKTPPASDYDETYTGYLTKSPSGTCEYDTWQMAIDEKEPPTNTIPTGVTGRILSEEQAGDTSTWIEIAQNGGYSLILRSNCEKPNSLFNSTANSRYSGSLLEGRMNTFYTDLPADSGLKQYAVMSDATSKIITSHAAASLSNLSAFSVPSVNKPTTTSGVAFALSYQEYARFCSLKNLSGASSAEAKSNFNLLKSIGDVDLTESMSRSPYGDGYKSFIQLTSKFYGAATYDGYFHSDEANLNFSAGKWCHIDYGNGWGVRPAMWVDSSIFYS